MKKICIATISCISLSSCEVIELPNNPEIEKIEKGIQTPLKKVKETKQPAPPIEKIISQPKIGQDKEKSFNYDLHNIIQGTPRHSFPSENIFY